MSNTRTFTGIKPEMVEKVQSKMAEMGIKLEGDQGKISHMGVKADYAFDRTAGSLTIANLDVGFPASFAGYTPDKIFGQIDEAIRKNA